MKKDNLFNFFGNRWGIVAALCTVTASGIGLSLSLPLLAMLFELRGFSSFMIGLNTTISSVGAIAIAPFVTPLAQRLGVSRLLTIAVMITSILLLSLFWIADFWTIIIFRFGLHAAITVIIILSEFWINTATTQKNRGLVLGIYTTMLSLGFMVGPLILKLIKDIHSIEPLLYGSIIISLALIPIYFAKNTVPKMLSEEGEPTIWKFFKLEPLAMLAVLIFAISESGLLSIFPVYGLRIGYKPQEFASFLVALSLGNIVFQIPIGLLIDRSNKMLLFVLFALFGCAGAMTIPFIVQKPNIFMVTVFLWGGIIPGLYTLGLSCIGTKFHGAELASANAAFIMNYSIGMLVGPLVVGFGMNSWSPHGAMWITSFIFGVLSIYSLSKIRTYNKDKIRCDI